MVLSRLTKITGPGVATDTNWVGNNADFTGITTTATSFNIGVTTIHSNLIEAHNIKSTGIITATGGSFSGNVTAVDGTFSGNVSIAGTLTYEDVTNIDSIGIITARDSVVLKHQASGKFAQLNSNAAGAAVIKSDPNNNAANSSIQFHVDGNEAGRFNTDRDLLVGNNIKLGNAGVITATSFVGSGAALTGIDATAIKDSGGNVKIQAQASGAVYTGIHTFSSGAEVGSNIKFGNAGVVTATSFTGSGANLTSLPAGQLTGTVADARISTLTASKLSGALPSISGANLTSLPAQATIANNADNRVITGGSGVNLNGESNLTYNNGKISVTGASGNTQLSLTRSDANTTGTTGTIGFYASDNHVVASMFALGDGDNEGAHLVFNTTSAASGTNPYSDVTERLRITSAGRVGINETSPDGELHIKGTNPYIYIEGTSGSGRQHKIWSAGGNSQALQLTSGELYYNADTQVFRATNESTEYLRITSDGAVSWRSGSTPLSGTSNNYSLNIYRDSGSGYGYFDVVTGSSNHTGVRIRAYHNGTYNNVFEHTTSDYTRFYTGGSERLRITSGGDVGVGNDSPNCRLAVKDVAEHTAYNFVTPSVGNCMMQLYNNPPNETANDHATIQFGVNGGSHNRVNTISAVAESAGNRRMAFTFCTDEAGSRSEKMRITGDGRIGIGIAAPNSRLNLKLSARGTSDFRITDSDTTADVLRAGSQADGDGFLQLRTIAGAGNVLFDSSGVSYINGGNFGLNETSPDTKLHISHSNATEDVIKLEATPVSAGTGERSRMIFQITQSNGQSMKLGHIASHSLSNWGGELAFHTKPANGTPNDTTNEVMRLHANGYVTKPYQPAFRATESAHAQTGFITFDQVVTNIGGHYNVSNGRFTAPIAGTYFFTFYGMAGSSSGNLRVEYYINGSPHSSGEHWGGVAYAHGGNYSHISCSTILTLAVNDYVNLHWNTSYNNLHSYHNGFMGYLIG